jgi:hypothetical protein
MAASIPANALACFNYLNLDAPKVRSLKSRSTRDCRRLGNPSRHVLELVAAPAQLVQKFAQRKVALEVKSALHRIHKVG